MAKVGAQRAAELTGRSKSTIQRAMNGGKLSFENDANGRRVIPVAELEKVFGLKNNDDTQTGFKDLEIASSVIETERLKVRAEMLEAQLKTANDLIADLKEQRELWQKQASQLLVSSQTHQKQAEELRQQIREREKKARERRQQSLQRNTQKLKAENENQSQFLAFEQDENFFQGLLRRLRA